MSNSITWYFNATKQKSVGAVSPLQLQKNLFLEVSISVLALSHRLSDCKYATFIDTVRNSQFHFESTWRILCMEDIFGRN